MVKSYAIRDSAHCSFCRQKVTIADRVSDDSGARSSSGQSGVVRLKDQKTTVDALVAMAQVGPSASTGKYHIHVYTCVFCLSRVAMSAQGRRGTVYPNTKLSKCL